MDMPWGEAIRLLRILRNDTSSQFATSCEGWAYPIERTTLAVLDVFDLLHKVNADPKKGNPVPHGGRPWVIENREVTRHGNAAGRTRAEVIEVLGRMRQGLPVKRSREPAGSRSRAPRTAADPSS